MSPSCNVACVARDTAARSLTPDSHLGSQTTSLQICLLKSLYGAMASMMGGMGDAMKEQDWAVDREALQCSFVSCQLCLRHVYAGQEED